MSSWVQDEDTPGELYPHFISMHWLDLAAMEEYLVGETEVKSERLIAELGNVIKYIKNQDDPNSFLVKLWGHYRHGHQFRGVYQMVRAVPAPNSKNRKLTHYMIEGRLFDNILAGQV